MDLLHEKRLSSFIEKPHREKQEDLENPLIEAGESHKAPIEVFDEYMIHLRKPAISRVFLSSSAGGPL